MDKTFWKNITSTIILAVLIVISYILLKPLIASILTGLLLALIFRPIYLRILKKVKKKDVSALLVCVLFILIIFIPLWFVTPIIVDQSISIYIASQQIDFVTPLEKTFPSLFKMEGFSSEIGSVIYSFVTDITHGVMNMLSNLILNFATIFLQSIVVFFVFFFVLRDGDHLISYIQSLLPFSKDVEKKLFKSSKDITFSVLYGQVVLGILQGLIVGVGLFLFGVNNALFLTIASSIAGIFPIIGTSIVWIPVAIYLFASNNITAALGICFFGMVSFLIENFFKPIFVSKRTNVHSAIILLGMIGGIFFLGILGAVIGPLVLSYLLIILEVYRDKRIPGVFIKKGE